MAESGGNLASRELAEAVKEFAYSRQSRPTYSNGDKRETIGSAADDESAVAALVQRSLEPLINK